MLKTCPFAKTQSPCQYDFLPSHYVQKRKRIMLIFFGGEGGKSRQRRPRSLHRRLHQPLPLALVKPPHAARLLRLNHLPRYRLDELVKGRVWRVAPGEESSLPLASLCFFLPTHLSLRVFDLGFFDVDGVHVAFQDAGCDVLPRSV